MEREAEDSLYPNPRRERDEKGKQERKEDLRF